ncbi:HIT zinc finger protein, putative [Medicago truncatula]|uniref:HIT zinc finger protein, putative n=1 Tax=Medicago truncatula TaxID=3880 RepID=G7I407_MEDTR|nr:HIT zinc finger protein, putative [Medicago truncatula]
MALSSHCPSIPVAVAMSPFEDSALSEETMENIMSGQEIDFDDLSLQEKKRFHRAIASGELSKMVSPWDPWWSKHSARKIRLSKEGTQLLQPLSEQEPVDEIGSNEFSEIPLGPEVPLPPLSNYCFTRCLCNGDWRSDPIGSVMFVLSLSSVLSQGGQPETVLEALTHFLEKVCVIDDVSSLPSLGNPAMVCALCDMRRLIHEGEKEVKSENPRKEDIFHHVLGS